MKQLQSRVNTSSDPKLIIFDSKQNPSQKLSQISNFLLPISNPQLCYKWKTKNLVALGEVKPNFVDIDAEHDQTLENSNITNEKAENQLKIVTRQSKQQNNPQLLNQQSSNLPKRRQYKYCQCEAFLCEKSKCSCHIGQRKCKNGCQCIPKLNICKNPYNTNQKTNPRILIRELKKLKRIKKRQTRLRTSKNYIRNILIYKMIKL